MDLKDKNLSLQFYNYLCNIVGSEEVVRTRRDIFTLKDIVENSTIATYISSGSKSEGIDLKGSDYDQMSLPNFIRVFESLNDVQYYPGQTLLVMETNDTKPGFTKLKLFNKSDVDTGIVQEWRETVGKETYISSKRVRELWLRDDMVIHGPCQSTADGKYDHAICLRCKEWITPAQQWIYRSRTLWPGNTLITSAVQYGVLFVPIGCKNSPNENLQWRTSFSVTEKLLIHSFTHTKLLCYALMKIILKDIIKPRHGDLLCSYFLKTIMFWLSEEIHPSEWKPENMISCFLDCISRLIYCVEYKTCLHYFIPENNLFEDRFTSNDHQALLATLHIVYGSPWIFIFETETFLNYRLQAEDSYGMALSASSLSCLHNLRLINSTNSIYSVFKLFGNGYKNSIRRDIITLLLCDFYRESIQSSDFNNLRERNKSIYKQYKGIFGHLKISLQSDAFTSWLLLASLFYQCKRFQECLVIINYCISRCTPDMILLKFTNSLVEQTAFKEMKHRCGLLLAVKHLIIDQICFRHPFCLLPVELRSVTLDGGFFIPPVVYSYLLQFLCFHHLGNYTGKQNSLHDLELTIREYYFIPNNYDTLGIVHASLDIVKSLL